MQTADDYLSTAIVNETLRFASSSLDASAAIFCWVGQRAEVAAFETAGVQEEVMTRYLAGCYAHDPLNIYELLGSSKRVAFLEQERGQRTSEENDLHNQFLGRYDIVDEVNFIFRQDDTPFALLAILKQSDDPPFGDRLHNWDAMQEYFEFNLKLHPRIRKTRIESMLVTQFGLRPRELQVVNLLRDGASNLEIAQLMGIGLATVKTYVISILDKLGVENRASVIAFLSRLPIT